MVELALAVPPVVHFEAPAAFRAWLEDHHVAQDELWVGYWKKSTRRASITWEESVDEALCFGWIDGLRRRVDDEAYKIRFTPRRNGSVWSLRNVERYETLLAEGRVAAAGEAAYERRVEDRTGLYSFEQREPLRLPAEFTARLQEDPDAFADWESRPPGYRRQVTHWIMSAKREATREQRLAALIVDSAAGRKVKPLR